MARSPVAQMRTDSPTSATSPALEAEDGRRAWRRWEEALALQQVCAVHPGRDHAQAQVLEAEGGPRRLADVQDGLFVDDGAHAARLGYTPPPPPATRSPP
jgi:hypothetical protein